MSNIFQQDNYQEFSGKHHEAVNARLNLVKEQNVVNRIWQKDFTVWNKSPEEISNRLGWLDLTDEMARSLSDLNGLNEELLNEGIKSAILLGMGGSSLAPEFFSQTFNFGNSLNLTILDSTHPDQIIKTIEEIDFTSTVIIVSTKSGSTVETLSLMNYFYREFVNKLGANTAGKHFIAITDPGSALEELSNKLSFRNLFLNNPNVGGRFSALSYFGLLPAVLLGVDVNCLIENSLSISKIAKNEDIAVNTPARLGTALGELATQGINNLVFITSKDLIPFKYWLEQLVAESIGKGNGLLPVIKDSYMPNLNNSKETYVFICLNDDEDINDQIKLSISSNNPTFVIKLDDIYEIGEEFLRWEFAVSLIGYVLGLNPFDQPDVESTKKLTREFLNTYKTKGSFDIPDPDFTYKEMDFYSETELHNIEELKIWIDNLINSESYLALLAFIEPNKRNGVLLNSFSTLIMEKYDIPSTYGFGPRYLHSTGQLHKGDSGRGVFIQLTSDFINSVPIPDDALSNSSSLDFGSLLIAQALGDYSALTRNGRNVVRVNLGKGVEQNLNELISIFT